MTDTTPIPSFDCFDVPSQLTPVDAARAQILTGLPIPNGLQNVALHAAFNRVLATDLRASADVPPLTNSAMDGYAIRSKDLALRTGDSDQVLTLSVTALALAGNPASVTVGPGECVQIMTGAALPDGADTVVAQEAVRVTGDHQIAIDRDQRSGQNVRAAGEDIRNGDVVLNAGKRLGAAELGVLASMGVAEVKVRPALRLAVFSTGDELREPGEPLERGQIHDSNRPILRALADQLGCIVSDLGILPDRHEAVRSALLAASTEHDVIITSGGVSTGIADFVSRTLQELGQLGVWRIALRPGRPFAHGRIGGCEFFGLPGNPVAVMVTFDQLVTPALRKLAGEMTDETPRRFSVRCSGGLRKKGGRTELYRAVLFIDDVGELRVASTGSQGSGLLTSMSTANCFAILDHDDESIADGDYVDVIPFSAR